MCLFIGYLRFLKWLPYLTLESYLENGSNSSYFISLCISNGVTSTIYRVKTQQTVALHYVWQDKSEKGKCYMISLYVESKKVKPIKKQRVKCWLPGDGGRGRIRVMVYKYIMRIK